MHDVNLSRRGFLKLLGLGGMVAAVSMFVNFAPLNMSSRQASAQTPGSWSLGADLTVTAIHATLLRNGKIMTTPGSGYHQSDKNGPFQVAIINPDTSLGTFTTVPDDLFCCGFSQLANGNILIAGGTATYSADTLNGKYHGGKFSYEFDVNSSSWNKISDMAHGRWYPGMGTLPDGKVYVLSGLDEYGIENDLAEIYDPVTKTFSIKYDPNPNANRTYCVGQGESIPGAGSPCYGGQGQSVNPDFSYYPRSIIMPSGYVFLGGQKKKLHVWKPVSGEWIWSDDMVASGRKYGAAVLLPLQNTLAERGRVLIAGGQVNNGTTVQNSAEIINFNPPYSDTSPHISTIAPMTFARMYQLPVMLPTGEIILFGGTSDSNVTHVLQPELFDPVNLSWTTLPSATVGRQYHSVAMLLPDGRVWTASGTPGQQDNWERRVEFFSPSYMFAGTRPIISGQPTVAPNGSNPYGGTITIPTPDVPTAQSITSVSLLRLGNVTHHFDAEHRLVWLGSSSIPFNNSGPNVVVNAPINANIAPPGYYMIHILKSGIPSVAKIIQIGAPVITGPDTTPPVIGITSPSARSSIVGSPSGVPITISGTASDPGSGVQSVKISIDSGAVIPVTSIVNSYELWSVTTPPIMTKGPHKIRAIATDNSNNTSSVEIPITVFFS